MSKFNVKVRSAIVHKVFCNNWFIRAGIIKRVTLSPLSLTPECKETQQFHCKQTK